MRTEQLRIKIDVADDGSLTATLAGISKSSKDTASAVEKLNREIGQIEDRADPGGRALRQLAADQSTLKRALDQGLITGDKYSAMQAGLNRNVVSGGMSFRALGAGVAAVGLAGIVKDTYSVNVEFQRLNGILVTLEGSQRGASARFRELQGIASETPAQLGEVIAAYSALKARGLDPSREALLAYMNVAAASGKTLQQFVEAVGDAATGEFERLKEFGVVARQSGDQVSLTFQGITTTVKKEAGAIEAYLQRIGKVNFAGAAADQMDTLGGSASNLGDSIQKLQVSIGEAGLAGKVKMLTQELASSAAGMADWLERANSREGVAGLVATTAAMREMFSLQGLIMAGANAAQGNDPLGPLSDEIRIRAANKELSETPGILDRVTGAYEVVANAAGRVYADALRESNERKADATKEVDKLLVKLREEEATYGLSKTALLDHEKAQALAKATTAEQRAEIEKLYTSLRAKTVAEDASGKSSKANAAEVQRFVDALKEQISAHGKSEQQLLLEDAARIKSIATTEAHRAAIDRLTAARIAQVKQDETVARMLPIYDAVLDDAKDSTQAYTALLQHQADALGGPVYQAMLRHKEMLEVITAQERALQLAGKSSAEVTAATAQARTNAAQMYAVELKEANEQARQAAMAQVEGYGRVMLNGIADLNPALRDAIMGGDWDEVGKSLADSLVAGMLETFFDTNVVKPLQDAFMRSMQGGGGSSGGGSLFSSAGEWGQFGSQEGWNAASANGPPSQLGGGGGPGVAGYANVAVGAYSVYDNYQNGPGGGEGALNGAMAGASAGAAFGPWGALIGGIVGGLAGLLGGAKDPDLRLGATGQTRKPEREFTTVFGSMQVGVRGGVDENDFIGLMKEFDQSIADLVVSVGGGADELQAITDRLSTWSVDLKGGEVNSENVLSSRLDAMIEAVEPTWANFLSQIDKVEDRVKAFQALYNIRDQIASFDDVLATLDLSPLSKLRLQLGEMNDAVTETGDAFAAAILKQDAVAIRDAAAEATQAIVARFQAEIEMVRSLEAALLQAQATARATDMQLAQRIVATGGASSIGIDAAAGNMVTTRGLVGSAASPERALAFLSEFIGSVDSWLQASIAGVQRLAQEQQRALQDELYAIGQRRTAISDAMALLKTESDAITKEATERTQAQAEQARGWAEELARREEAVRQARIDALQQELELAHEYQRIAEVAHKLIKDLTYNASNPLGGQARLALITQDIESAQGRVANTTGAERATQATQLLDLLQQRLGMVQSEGLMQRPGDDYLALYNETLRQIANVEAIATPEAALALQLQEDLKRLQEDTVAAVREQTGNQVAYTAEERTRLDAILAEEAAYKEELRTLDLREREIAQEVRDINLRVEAEIAALNAEARVQYEWARGEAARLEAERAQAIVDQLELITGGTPIEQFIADRQAESTALLTDIRTDLRNFLAAISSGAYSPGTTNPLPPPGSNGGGGRPPGDNYQMPAGVNASFSFTINTGGNADIGRVVQDELNKSLPQLTTRIKREWSTA